MGGGIHPHLYVRGLSYTQHIFYVESQTKKKNLKKEIPDWAKTRKTVLQRHMSHDQFYLFAEISVFESKNENLKWYDFAK